MTSKEKLNSIESLINEFYHDMKCKGNLNDCADECWKEYQEFCEDIKQDLERLEKVKKELNQTKSNFKNSQTHSKSHYKRLIDKYLKLEKENQDLKELYDFQSQLNLHRCKSIKELYEKNLKLEDENSKFKKVIEILTTKEIHIVVLKQSNTYIEYNDYMNTMFGEKFWNMSKEDFDLLKEYL